MGRDNIYRTYLHLSFSCLHVLSKCIGNYVVVIYYSGSSPRLLLRVQVFYTVRGTASPVVYIWMIGERKLHGEATSEFSGQIETEEFCPICTELMS